MIALAIPFYLGIIGYAFGYGLFKGKAYWDRDYWFFTDAMEQCKLEEEMELQDQLDKERNCGMVVEKPSFIPTLKKEKETIH